MDEHTSLDVSEASTPQDPALNGTTSGQEPYSQESIDRLTGAQERLSWDDLDYEDRLEYILGNPKLTEWFDDAPLGALDTLSYFRKIPQRWGLIKTQYQEYRGFPPDLEKAVDAVLLGEREASHPQEPTPPAAHAILLQGDSITQEEVSHLWQPYIPRKMATLLDGDPGVGKTGLACLIAACVSRGWSLPDETGKPPLSQGEPSNVLMVAMEDHLGAVIIPRLKQCGADLSRITFVNEITDAAGNPRPFTLADLPLLTEHFERVRPRSVYIDAIQAVLGPKVDINRANQVTALLAPLKKLAEQYECAVLCSRHPAKPGQHVAKVLYRGMGSQAFVGTVRSGLFVEEHPGDATKALLVHYKVNAGRLGCTQIFSKAQGKFEWAGASRITHRALAGDGTSGPLPQQKLKAALWLETHLKAISVPASALLQEAEDLHDFSKKVMRAAAECIGVTKTQVLGDFLWSLPPLSPPTSITGTSGVLGGTGGTGGTGIDWPILEKTDISTVKEQEPQDTPDDPVTQVHPVHPVLSEESVDDEVYTKSALNLYPSDAACPQCGCPDLMHCVTYRKCPVCAWREDIQ